MKILFVYPNKDKNQPGLNQLIIKIMTFSQPSTLLTFPSIAAVTPKQHDIKIIEGNINDINFNEECDLVGISCLTATAFMSYEIADEFRRRGVPVVLGGWHPSALPEEAKQHADSVVIGEAEETWPQLLNDLEKGQIQPFYYQTRAVDLALIPNARNIYPKKSVPRVQATRGCPHGCEFCSMSNAKFGKIYRIRPIENVVREIQSIPSKYFGFHDNSLTINIDYTKELFRRMKLEGINKKFFAYGNINILGKDDELLRLASDAGCTSWFVGLESICQDSLNSAGKVSNKVDEYSSSIKKIHDYGMYILGSFIFGFDTDTKDIFDNTLELVYDIDIDHGVFNILTPYPGTALFDRYEKEGRILTRDWSKYNMHDVVFEPKNMTPDYLRDNAIRVSDKFYTLSNCMRRTIANMKVLGPYESLSLAYVNLIRRNYYHYIYER